MLSNNTNKGAHSKTDHSAVTMMTMTDSPKTHSYFPCSKWMNTETLISSLNASTKQLTLCVKLQVLHMKVE
jgi:hypothetical protein